MIKCISSIVINMTLSKKQISTMELIGELCDRFGDDRLFTQSELPGVTKHTMDALTLKGYLEGTMFNKIAYYHAEKRLESES